MVMQNASLFHSISYILKITASTTEMCFILNVVQTFPFHKNLR